MTFAEELRPLVEAVGGVESAAAILQVDRVTVQRWMRGHEPSKPAQCGAIKILEDELSQPED